MATEDDFAHIWYADGNGNVTGYVVNGGDKASTIIDAYNEHFGTGISIWTPEKKSLQVGDTVPNWSAYEKILTFFFIKVQSPAVAGYIENETCFIYTKNNNCYSILNENGEVRSDSGPALNDGLKNYIKEKAISANFNVMLVEPKEESFEIGQNIENWNNYVAI